jgi:ABC-type branched-subunit amino acid transport system ATPase component
MSQPIIDAQNLSAAYGSVTALRGVNLAIEKGEIFGLLGPNGAETAQGKPHYLPAWRACISPKEARFMLAG